MKTTSFATTIQDLQLILSDTADLQYFLGLDNRPNQKDVMVTVIAKGDVMFDFINRNNLKDACSEIIEA